MRMVHEDRPVISSGALASQDFTIKANGKAFKILIDKLYSDKPRAILRELMTNAYDAHLMVGKKDVPFQVVMPSVFDPMLVIRDFGPGMSHQQIMMLYTTVFESTKDQDNTAVGKWGLGSKSPFAYTDTFIVQNYDGEYARVYRAYINTNGVPVLDFIGENPSDAPRGFEVSFSVTPTDVGTFVEALQRVCAGFDVLPEVKGIDPATISTYPTSVRGTFWRMLDKTAYNAGQPYFPEASYAVVRQGCVLYPIDVTLLKANPLEEAFLSNAVMIDMPIGSVEIAPSREALSYDATTITNLKEAIHVAVTEFVADTQTKVNTFRTWIEASRCFASYVKHLPSNHQSLLQKTVKYRGNACSSMMDLTGFVRNGTKTYEDGGVVYGALSQDKIVGRSYGRKKAAPELSDGSHNIDLTATYTVVLENPNKVKKSGPARIRAAVTNGLITAPVLWVRANQSAIALKRILVLMGRPKVVLMDDLPAPQAGTKATTVRTKVRCRIFNGTSSGPWPETTVSTADEHYFVRADRGKLQNADGMEIPVWRLNTIIKSMKKLGIMSNNTTVLVVPKTLSRLIKKAPAWVDVIQTASAFATERLDQAMMKHALRLKMTMTGAGSVDTFLLAVGPGSFMYDGDARVSAARWHEIAQEHASCGDMLAVIELGCSLSLDAYAKMDLYPDVLPTMSNKQLTDRYPLLVFVKDGDEKHYPNWVEYVDMCDRTKLA